MDDSETHLVQTVDILLEKLPAVWDRIRTNLRTAGITKFGITLDQFHVLRHIRKGYCTVGELADKKQTSRSAVSQAVEVLVNKGLVTRKTSAGDRRYVLLELTSFASRVMDENLHDNRVWMKNKMKALNEKELDEIQTVMTLLKKSFVDES